MATDSNTEALAYNIRPVNLGDTPQLVENLWQARSLDDAHAYLRRTLQTIDKGRAIAIIAQCNQAIIGYSVISRLTRCYEISDVSVAESYRGQGIGTAMISYLINQVDKNTSLPIEIGVAASNTKALTLYYRLGFTQDYHLMLDVGNGQERVLYLRYNAH